MKSKNNNGRPSRSSRELNQKEIRILFTKMDKRLNAENTPLPPLIPDPLEKYDSIPKVIQSSDVTINFPSLIPCSHEKCNSIPKATQILHAINVQPELDNNVNVIGYTTLKNYVFKVVYPIEVHPVPNTINIDELTGPIDKKQEILDNRKKLIIEGSITDTDFDVILEVYTEIIYYYREELDMYNQRYLKVKFACETLHKRVSSHEHGPLANMFTTGRLYHMAQLDLSESTVMNENLCFRKWNFPLPSNNIHELDIQRQSMNQYYHFLNHRINSTNEKLNFAKKCFQEISSLRK